MNQLKSAYESPRIRAFEVKPGSILCSSTEPLGSTSNESYREEKFEW